MKKNHNFFSRLALNLAEVNLGKTKTNPSVGCVIVKNNSVVSSGITSINGRPHAEFNALNKNKFFTGSKMYVSMEPCTHYGLTPPCTKIIKKKKIQKVYYSSHDPDHRTFKKAKLFLNKYKIKSKKVNVSSDIYQSYFINTKYGLPHLDAKIAISKDIFTINKKEKWITNKRSRKVSHLLRSRYDCILSTSKSINKDNSLLNCRIDGLNNFKPELIIIDRNLKLKKNLKLLNISKKRNTYIVTTINKSKKINFFKKKNIKFVNIKKLNQKKDFLILLNKIYKKGKRRILVESGLTFINSLIKNNLIKNLYIFKSDINLKNNGYNNSFPKILKKINFNNKLKVNLNGDNLFKIRIK